MRFLVTIWIILFSAIYSLGNANDGVEIPEEEALSYIFTYSPNHFENKELGSFKAELDSYSKKIENSRRYKDKKYTLEKVYYHIHKKYLKEYHQYSSLTETYKTGKYDCLTATAIYSYIFNELGYAFKVIKSDFHIFLVVNLEGEQILLETTSSLNGIVTGNKINERLELYAKDSNSKLRKVKMMEIAGLVNFNVAVKNFNEGNFGAAFNHLEKATSFSRDRSILDLLRITMMGILDSTETYSDEERKEFLLRYQKISEAKSVV